jgi:hypothetical protein
MACLAKVMEALLKGCVVTSELELVLPFELQGDLIKRGGRLRYQASGHDQPYQEAKIHRRRKLRRLPIDRHRNHYLGSRLASLAS